MTLKLLGREGCSFFLLQVRQSERGGGKILVFSKLCPLRMFFSLLLKQVFISTNIDINFNLQIKSMFAVIGITFHVTKTMVFVKRLRGY